MNNGLENFSLRECMTSNCSEVGLEFRRGVLLADRFDRPNGFEISFYRDSTSKIYYEVLLKTLHEYQAEGDIEIRDGIVGDMFIKSNQDLVSTEKQLGSVILFVMRHNLSSAQVMLNSTDIV